MQQPLQQKSDEVTATTLVQKQTYHEGPLPAPQILAEYENLLPGAAERILAMAEANAAHSMEMEKKLLEAQIADAQETHTDTRRGQWGGIFSVAAAFALAGLALYCGHPTVAGTICSVTILSLVTVFVTGRPFSSGQKASKDDH